MPNSNGRAVKADGHRNPLPNGSGRLIGFGEAAPALRRIDVDPQDCRRNLTVRQEPVLPIRSAVFQRQVSASYYSEQKPYQQQHPNRWAPKSNHFTCIIDPLTRSPASVRNPPKVAKESSTRIWWAGVSTALLILEAVSMDILNCPWADVGC